MSDYDPGAHTVQEVVDYASEHPDEVAAILEAEQAGKNRSTLVSKLEGGDDPDAEGDDDDPEAGLTVTTTRTKDFLNRALVNPTPGTSQATDYLARSVVTGNVDYLGRALVP